MKDNKKNFKPFGPYHVKFENLPGGKRITREDVSNFWKTNTELGEKVRPHKGIYIFGMEVTKGIIPCYVGKTKNNFEKECFTSRNMEIYNGEIIRYERNYKPFMLFLVYCHQEKQKISDKVIRELEKFIINLALEKNSDLVNTRGIQAGERFVIKDLGGRGSGKGAPTKAGKFFKKMMNY
jgi:hypothetical protein